MATLCRMCADEAETSVSLLETSHHHLQWAIKNFSIELDDVLPTSVCSQCDNIILEWILFLSKREKARTLFSTMIATPPQLAKKIPHSSVPRTKKLQHPRILRRILPRPHTSNTSVPSKPSTSGHSAASAPDLSLPLQQTEYHIKDFTIIMSRLSNQVLDSLQQNVTVDCNVVDNQMSDQRNENIKLKPVAVDPCLYNAQVLDNLQQNLSSTEDNDDIEVPFEAIYVPVVRCEPDLVKTEPNSDLSAAQTEIHRFDDTMVTVKQEEGENAEEYSDAQPDLPEFETSPETSNPGSNKDINVGASVFNCAHCNFTTNCRNKIKSHFVNYHVKMLRYQCQECSKYFKYKRSLQRHIGLVHPKCSYKHPLCQLSLKLEKYFNIDIKNHDKLLHCKVCGKILSRKHAPTEHKMTILTQSSSLSCNMCSKIFDTIASLKLHTIAVHSNISYECDTCGKCFKTTTHLFRHQHEVHAPVRPFTCNQCERIFVSNFALKQHSAVHSDLRPFKCEKCGSCFKNSSNLSKHIRIVHCNVRAFKCHLCGKSCKRKFDLSKHLISHSDVRNYKCELCGKQFKTKSVLKQHLTRHSEIRPFACAQCRKNFKCKAELEAHLNYVHTDLRPFSCDKCNLCFKLKSSLSYHMRTVHGNVRAFKCHFCDKSIISKSGLKSHLIRHSDVRNYKCEQCGKQTKTKQELKQHLRSHVETRPFTCAQCNKKFKTKANLVQHLRHAHSDLRPFSCDKCSYACKSKPNLNKHQLAVHRK